MLTPNELALPSEQAPPTELAPQLTEREWRLTSKQLDSPARHPLKPNCSANSRPHHKSATSHGEHYTLEGG